MPFVDTTLRKTLLVMLRTTIAGEAMNARDKTLQIVKSAGYGPHELADALLTLLQKTPKQGGQNGSEPYHREMAEYCWNWFEAGGHLSEKEQSFVEDMMVWRKPSEKQLKWLKDIYARITTSGRSGNGR
jgi:hypothetical protein